MKKILSISAFLALSACLVVSSRAQETVDSQSDRNADIATPVVNSENSDENVTVVFGWHHAVILGVVEGLTEFIPVSSTGHLILVSHFMRFGDAAVDPVTGNEAYTLKKAVDTYSIVIQFGAIIAVVFLFKESVFLILAGLFRRNREGLLLTRNLILSFLPAAFFGLLLENLIDRYLFNQWTVISALFVGALFMFYLDSKHKRAAEETGHELDKDLHELSVGESLLIGLFQCIAMWPGMSRSLMAIAGGYFAGLSPRRAAEYSFLLGLPTLSAASVYKLIGSGDDLPRMLGWMPIILGLIISCLSALLAMKWLIDYLNRHGLALFAWYRIALAGAVLSVLLIA